MDCEPPHAECLPHADGKREEIKLSADAPCSACRHRLMVHSLAGMCLVGKDPHGKAAFLAPGAQLPRGWSRCACQAFQAAPKRAEPASDPLYDLDDSEDGGAEEMEF